MFFNNILLNFLFVITDGNKNVFCLSLKVGRYKAAKQRRASLGLFRAFEEPTFMDIECSSKTISFFPKNF
jgi:hypothetical protein